MLDDCEKCGQPHPRCHAHNREKGPCGRSPMIGLTVCYKHGGATKAAREKGLRVRALQDAEAKNLSLLEKFGAEVNPNLSVIDQYDNALATAVAWMDICTQQLEALTIISFETNAGERKLDARIHLFERSLERVEKFLNNAQHLNLAERRTQVTEAQQAILAEKWHAATIELFTRLRTKLAAYPEALEAVHQIETQAPDLVRPILNTPPPPPTHPTQTP